MSTKTFTMGRTRGALAAIVALGHIPVWQRQQTRVGTVSTRHRNGWRRYRGGSNRASLLRHWLARTSGDAAVHFEIKGTRKLPRAQRKAARLAAQKGQSR